MIGLVGEREGLWKGECQMGHSASSLVAPCYVKKKEKKGMRKIKSIKLIILNTNYQFLIFVFLSFCLWSFVLLSSVRFWFCFPLSLFWICSPPYPSKSTFLYLLSIHPRTVFSLHVRRFKLEFSPFFSLSSGLRISVYIYRPCMHAVSPSWSLSLFFLLWHARCKVKVNVKVNVKVEIKFKVKERKDQMTPAVGVWRS